MMGIGTFAMQARLEKLKSDVNMLFNLEWLREEAAAVLVHQKAPKGKSAWATLCFLDQTMHNDSYKFLASQLLISYYEARREVASLFNEDSPDEIIEGYLNEAMEEFLSDNTSLAWVAVSADEDAEKRTTKWHQSAIQIFQQYKNNRYSPQFFHRLNKLAILNDVRYGRAKLHGLDYKAKPMKVVLDPVDVFCDYVKELMQDLTDQNGKVIKTNNKGRAGQYVFHLDADLFCRAMDILRNEDRKALEDYLNGKKAENVKEIQLVCPLIGYVVREKLINNGSLRFVDLGNSKSNKITNKNTFVRKLSFPVSKAGNHLFSQINKVISHLKTPELPEE